MPSHPLTLQYGEPTYEKTDLVIAEIEPLPANGPHGPGTLIDGFRVKVKRRGDGTRAYAAWERAQPPGTVLYLYSIVHPFWHKMGFVELYEPTEDPDDESIPETYWEDVLAFMVKIVGALEQPAPIPIDAWTLTPFDMKRLRLSSPRG